MANFTYLTLDLIYVLPWTEEGTVNENCAKMTLMMHEVALER